MLFHRKHSAALTPPEGLGAGNIEIERSICTGEQTIGFREPCTGRLRCAVVVHDTADIDAFYRSYGFEPPQH